MRILAFALVWQLSIPYPRRMSDHSRSQTATPPIFYPALPLKVVLFTTISGGFYLHYWMYRSWRAYRDAEGYSACSFWQTVKTRTGYRPSPLWRAVLWPHYALGLFPAIGRECRLRGMMLPISPAVLAFALILALLASGSFTGGALLPGLALVPIQVAVNRVNPDVDSGGWSLRPVEGLLVIAGAIFYWGNA